MDGGWAELHPWRISRAPGAEPVFRQIYAEIRTAIAARTLGPGARLPSTRELAASLGVSRTSVVSAYEQLAAEGWIDSRTGSGAYVGADLPAPFGAQDAPAAAPARFGPDPEALFAPLVASDDPAEPVRESIQPSAASCS